MGIKDYTKWIMSKYSKAFTIYNKKNIPMKFDNVYVDLNYLLHLSLHRATSIKTLISGIHFNLNYGLNMYEPMRSISICVDGPSSFSKLLLQKKRRKDDNKLIDDTKELSSTHLTFGSRVMKQITDSLPTFIENNKKKHKYINPDIKVNGPEFMGEGEIKIFNEIILNDEKRKNENHLVITVDSDAFLLAIMSNKLNIHIALKKKEGNYVFSLNDFLIPFFSDIGYSNTTIYFRKNTDLRAEFVFVSILFGNDYFAKIDVSFNKILETYYDFSNKREKTGNEFVIKSNTNNTCSIVVENAIKLFESLYDSYNPKKKKELVIFNNNTKDMVENYLQGLIWCLNTYKTGLCDDYTYCYGFEKPPKVSEILVYLKSLKTKEISYIKDTKCEKINNILNNNFFSYEYILLPSSSRCRQICAESEKKIISEFPELHGTENCEECVSLKNKNISLKKKGKQTIESKAVVEELKTHRKNNHGYSFTKSELIKFIELIDTPKLIKFIDSIE